MSALSSAWNFISPFLNFFSGKAPKEQVKITENQAALKIQRWYRSKQDEKKHELTKSNPLNLKAAQGVLFELDASKDKKKNLEFYNKQWNLVKEYATTLHPTHYVFTHSSSLSHGLFVDMATHLDLSISNPAFSRRWNLMKKMRPRGVAPNLFKNTEEYFKSEMCKKIQSGQEDDGYPNNAHLLSCDAYLDNDDIFESSFYFFKENTNCFKPDLKFSLEFFKKYIKNENLSKFAAKEFHSLLSSKSLSKKIPGRVYVIAIEKAHLQDKTKRYVFRAHPFGKVCSCNGSGENQGDFIKKLEEHQKGDLKKLCPLRDENGAITEFNPQYRILTGSLDKDPTRIVSSFDCLSSEIEREIKPNFWRIAQALKSCQRIEGLLLDTPKEQIVFALLRIHLDLSKYYSVSSTNRICKTELKIDPSSNDLYLKGLKEILRSKKEVFLEHKAYIEKHLSNEHLKFLTECGALI